MRVLLAAVCALPLALPIPPVDGDPADPVRPASLSLTLAPAAGGDWTLSAVPDAGEGFDRGAGRVGALGSPLAFTFNLAAMARYSLLAGSVENRDAYYADIGHVLVIAIPDHIRYGDLFSNSVGYGLEIDLALSSPATYESPFYPQDPVMGLYLSFEADSLHGQRYEDDLGNYVTPGDMTMYSALIGFKVEEAFGGGFLGGMRLGLGAAHSTGVDAVFGSVTVPGGAKGELFASTWHCTFESRLHAGYRMGPLAITFGTGVRIDTPPEEGDGVGSGSLSPKLLFLIDFDAGVELGF
jgi:hypothetical protein